MHAHPIGPGILEIHVLAHCYYLPPLPEPAQSPVRGRLRRQLPAALPRIPRAALPAPSAARP